MKTILNKLNFLHNIFQLFSCSFIFGYFLINFNNFHEKSENLVLILRIIQIEQILDILFNFFNRGGGIFTSMMQIIGRNFVALYIIDKFTDRFSLSLVIICWNLADIIRFLFYINKNKIITFIRYNAFKLLYPIGILGECLTIENVIQREEKIKHQFYRLLQLTLIIGMIYLYLYLLKKSNQVFKKELTNENKKRN